MNNYIGNLTRINNASSLYTQYGLKFQYDVLYPSTESLNKNRLLSWLLLDSTVFCNSKCYLITSCPF